MKNLLYVKNLLSSNDLLYIETLNNETGWIGCASFYTNGEDKIMVFEGDPSGSNDAGYTYDDFLSKYTYCLKVEA